MRPCARSLRSRSFLCCGSTPPGFDFVDPKFLRDGTGSAFVIAREHDYFDAQLMQRLDRVGGRFFDRIGDGENTRGAAIDGDEHGAVTLLSQLRGFCFQRLEITHACCGQERCFANEDTAAVDFATHTAVGGRFEILNPSRLNTALNGAGHNRDRERVFALRFDSHRGGEQFLLGN